VHALVAIAINVPALIALKTIANAQSAKTTKHVAKKKAVKAAARKNKTSPRYSPKERT